MKTPDTLLKLGALCGLFFWVGQSVAEVVPPRASRVVLPSVINENHPLSKDIYDYSNPDFKVLQTPAELLKGFPRDKQNRIDWMAVINSGMIAPRANVSGTAQLPIRDQDIIMKETKGMPYVLFPHLSHTKWLACKNCHNRIFKAKVNGSPVNMSDILKGKYCGTCHGKVAFPANEACERCHNIPKPGQKAWWK